MSQNIFKFNEVQFTSIFDSGNLGHVESINLENTHFRFWSAPDNNNTSYQTSNCFWFYFSLSGLQNDTTYVFQSMNTFQHASQAANMSTVQEQVKLQT